MTHTVHPYAHRLGIIRDWKSRWFAIDKKSYRENIAVDAAIRGFLKKRLRSMHVADVEIERSAAEVRIIIHTARPGLVIGRSGENATKLRSELTAIVHKASSTHGRTVKVDIIEIRERVGRRMEVAARLERDVIRSGKRARPAIGVDQQRGERVVGD